MITHTHTDVPTWAFKRRKINCFCQQVHLHPHHLLADMHLPGVPAAVRAAHGGGDGDPHHGLGDPGLLRRRLLEKETRLVQADRR